jgi:hypothetical protein
VAYYGTSDPRVTRSIRLKPRLKDAREGKALSQAALGRLIDPRPLPGFRATHIGLFELGYRDATWAEVEALAAALQVDARWLAGQEAAPRNVAAMPASPVGAGLAQANSRASEAPSPSPPLRLPPAEVPARRDATEVVFREELGRMLAKANQMLNDRSLLPPEWRAWREHAERVKAALRAV